MSLLASTFLIATSLAGIASKAVAATSADTDFFSVTPEKLPAHTNVELNQIFTTGVGPYSSSMLGKIYPYMLPQNAIGNVPYNGCYDEKNNRLGGLDGDNSCAAWMKTRPGISIFRLFIGYKVDCAQLSTTGGCLDMALLMNCQYTQVQIGTGPFDGAVAPRVCSKGSPIIRKAKANSNNSPAFDGCYPGQDGTTYPVCTSCGNGEYNGTIGANKSACTPCTASSISGATNAATPPTQFITVPTNGAYASSQCQIALSDSWTCAVGYIKTVDNQACVPAPSCSLALNVTPTSPSAVGAADGKIIATYSGESGTVSAFAITTPTYLAPNPLSGTTGTFDGLVKNTYKVSVTDSSCTTSTSITLSDPVPCALLMTATGTNPTTSTGTDGKIAASTSGAVGTVSFTSSSGSVTTSGSSANVTGLGGGTFTVTATDAGASGCSKTQSVTLTGSTVKCSLKYCHMAKSFPTTCYTDGTNSGSGIPTTGGFNSKGDSCAVSEDAGSAAVACGDPTLCIAAPPPPCDPVTTIATATTAVSCQYSCSSDTYGIGVRSGYLAVGESCSSASAKARRANGTGCSDPTQVSCGFTSVPTYAGVYQTCKDYTCPATTTKYMLWDAGGLIKYRTIMGNTYGGQCYNPSGSDTYYGCGGTPPPSGPDPFTLCANGYYGVNGRCTQ